MSTLTLTVNGRPHTVDVDPATPLLYVLSDDLEHAGAEVRLRPRRSAAPARSSSTGEAIRSCVTPVSARRRRRHHDARRTGHARAAASDSAGVHRRAGGAVRLLPERRDPDGEGASSTGIPKADRRADPATRCPACCAAASRTRGCCARSSGTREEAAR